jgi:hypothetical protein
VGHAVSDSLKKIFEIISDSQEFKSRFKSRIDYCLEEVERSLDSKFHVYHKKNPKDPLAALCDKYGSDKGEIASSGHPYAWPSHSYTDLYSRLFSHCRASVKKVFECGLGTNNPDIPSSMGISGRPGASLRVWRDYFPNASIYGADIDSNILFEEERIKTFFIDQTDPDTIKSFWEKVGETDFDLMVDDGLHTFEGGKVLFKHSIDYLSQTGIYVIEDVSLPDLLRFKEFFANLDYVVDYITMFQQGLSLGDNSLIVVRK